MPFQIIPHTADVRLSVEADGFAALVSESLAALMMIIEGKGKGVSVTREVELSARDKTSLLVDFLNEVLALSHINREIYEVVRFEKVSETKISARLNGFRVDGFEGDVKAVTYHEAEVVNENGKWSVNLVLDV